VKDPEILPLVVFFDDRAFSLRDSPSGLFFLLISPPLSRRIEAVWNVDLSPSQLRSLHPYAFFSSIFSFRFRPELFFFLFFFFFFF